MNDYIGKYVKQFESGNKGSRALAQCGNDWGLSCGSYQLTLRWGNCISFLKKYFFVESKDLYFNNLGDFASPTYPGTRYCSSPIDVKKVWNLCIESVGEEKFFEYEHEFIKNMYYDKLCSKLNGLFDPNKHSRALQESLWSWSVHKGASGAYNGLKQLSSGYNLQTESVESLLNRIYDYRYNVNRFDRYSKSETSERMKLLGIKKMKPLIEGKNDVEDKPIEVKPFMIVVTSNDNLNIRKGAGANYEVCGSIAPDGKKYTIIDVKGNWGKLKSGLGWINLSYTKRV